jgi:hypothetical protein
MAVVKKYQGKGSGEWLFVDALKRLLSASNEVGFPFVSDLLALGHLTRG